MFSLPENVWRNFSVKKSRFFANNRVFPQKMAFFFPWKNTSVRDSRVAGWRRHPTQPAPPFHWPRPCGACTAPEICENLSTWTGISHLQHASQTQKMLSWNKKHQNLFRKVKSKTNTKLLVRQLSKQSFVFKLGTI